ncbi:MAG: hypothetical protein HC933_11825, partial [Pleurocapsa sp. SU_196_0]|nr:hypothetical protein [Pleurocapsa sp. SU_196_0]
NFMQANLLFVSVIVAAIFVGALLAFVTVLARGAEAPRTLEVVAYSFVPFLLGVGVFGLLTVFGATGIVIGQGLLLGAVLIGWYRLYMGLEIMTGTPTKALLGAVLGPLAALLFTFLVPGLLLRLLGL